MITLLVGGCVAVAVAPPVAAGVVDCANAYQAALTDPPQGPSVNEVVSLGPPLTVNGDVVAGYAVTFATHYAGASESFATCTATAAHDLATQQIDCVTSSPGVQNADDVPDRYVTVTSLTVQVHHNVVVGDVNGITECFGFGIADE